MKNDTIVHYHELGNDKLDNVCNAVSLCLGVPGNILIFLAFRSFPTSACKFLYRLLALFDFISLVLLFTRRPLMWSDILQFEHKRTTAFLTIYLNVIYYISIFANMILVLLALERLLHAKYPSSYNQYFGNLDRVKLTLIIEGLLIMAFCLIITIKMSYFGMAWTVIFLTFYTVAPSLCLLACVLLLAVHYYKKYKDRKFIEKNKPLTASNSSFAERSPSRHSTVSASGPLRGSSSSIAYKGRKKDPYSLYLVEKSASESHLATAASPKHKTQNDSMTKSKSGNCVNTVVSLKVPQSTSYLSIHKTVDSKGDYITQEQDEQLRLKKTRSKQMTFMSAMASMVVIVCCFPLTVCAARLMKEDKKDFDLSDTYTYTMIMTVNITMYVTHSCKFVLFFLVSSVFRRHVFATVTCRHQALKQAEAVTSTH